LRQKQHSVTRQELFDLVWKTPVLRLAPRFGLSDVGFRKLCLRYDIPLPARGYWTKQSFGKTLPRPVLPVSIYAPDDRITIVESERPKQPKQPATASRLAEIEIRDALSHPLVLQTAAVLGDRQPHYYDSARRPWNALDVDVPPPFRNRALRLLDALIRGLEAAGAKVACETHTQHGHT